MTKNKGKSQLNNQPPEHPVTAPARNADTEWMSNVTNGFDVVIGNPPYIKEYTNKKAFTNIKGTSYYMGKMDIWYYFACKGIDMLTNNGLLCFIATNNWITSTGAKKLRTKVINDTQILKIIDFGAFMIFDNADIQTMVMQFRRDTSLDTYTVDYRRLDKPDAILDDALALLKRVPFQNAVYLSSKICRSQFSSHSFSFVNDCVSPILTKIDNFGSFKLNDKEIGQGVVIPQDCLNKDCQKILGEPHFAGEGIFVLSTPEINDLNLTKMEMSLIRPYFTSTQVQRYVTFSQNTHWLIYTDSSYNNSRAMDHYPHLKNHLDRFQDIITSDNKPYGLHRARNERFFMGEKIVALRKCVDRPLFSYSDFDCYVSATFYVIKTSRLNCKYLLGILNSNLIAFWLRFRGKMQGENFQLDKEPLLNIPIATDENESSYRNLIEDKVHLILAAKKADPLADTSALESEIDQLVYQLYGLTDEEIAVVEASSKKDKVQMPATHHEPPVATPAENVDDDDSRN